MVTINTIRREPFTVEELAIIEVSRQYFWFFLLNVFAPSFEGQTYLHDDGTRRPYEFGALHLEWAILAQFNPRLCVMAPRSHLKSTVLGQAFAFWQLFKTENGEVRDGMYFSYKAGLAGEQVESLLRVIRGNPYCRFWKDLKRYGRTQIDFLVDFGYGIKGECTLKAEGIFSATRGRHPKFTICDDILSDFSNPLASADLERINRIFRQAIMSLPPNPDDPLIVVGTPQSYDDILYQLNGSEDFLWVMYPAVINDAEKTTQWPEKFTYERLMRLKRSSGPTAFEVEYMLVPVRVLDQFFTRDSIVAVIDARLKKWELHTQFINPDLSTYGGFDVGRYVHPSHAAVFLELPTGTLVQVYGLFMDQYNYNAQIKLLNAIADVFDLDRGYYDSTFNALEDRGLSTKWRGRSFNRKLKADMATLFEKKVYAVGEEPRIVLLNDQRQLNQITLVDKKLSAATTASGHGDAFWSIGLAVKAADDGPGMVSIGSANPVSRGRAWASQIG